MQAVPAFCAAVLAGLGRSGWELSVVLCGRGLIRRLNRDWRGMDEPTDVLSFSQEEGEPFPRRAGGRPAGDLVVCLPIVAENARGFGLDREEELRRVLVHGILHLAGMDHADNSPRRKMLRLQEKLLRELDRVRFQWR